MTKDPAFLLYSSDFLTGTMFMTNEQVGKYIRLMCVQHQKGHLSEKDMLNICSSYDEDVYKKFQKDESGLYFNKRLENEISKRKAYSESRRQNRLKGKNISTSYVPHMENENVNENVDSIIKTIPIVEEAKPKKKRFIAPLVEEVISFFNEKGFSDELAKKAFEYYATSDWHDSEGKKVVSWKQKMLSVWMTDKNRGHQQTKPLTILRAVSVNENDQVVYENGKIYGVSKVADLVAYRNGEVSISIFDRKIS